MRALLKICLWACMVVAMQQYVLASALSPARRATKSQPGLKQASLPLNSYAETGTAFNWTPNVRQIKLSDFFLSALALLIVFAHLLRPARRSSALQWQVFYRSLLYPYHFFW